VTPVRDPEIVLHVGTHKTGTTAFQHWLRSYEPRFIRRHDVGVYRGLFGNAREVALLCADRDRSMPSARRIPEWTTDSWRAAVRAHVEAELDRPVRRLVLSCETLSFLRQPEEVRRLAELVDGRRARVVLCTRRPEDFLISWADHLKRDGFELSDDPASFAHVGPESWLVDYQALHDVYAEVFGSVARVDYDAEMARHGSVIPGLMNASFPEIDRLPEWRGFRTNLGTYRAHEIDRSRKLSRRLVRALRDPFGALDRLARRLRG